MHFMTILTLGLAGTAIALPHAPRASATPTYSVSLASATPTVITSASASASSSATPSTTSRFPDPRSIFTTKAPAEVVALQKTYYHDYVRYHKLTGREKELWARKLENDLNALRASDKDAGIYTEF
ncbi:hypothetical protein N7493_011064 [Penicillium malachiteum]|uniref:Uncharacterized protein n=1 Tax=Penicillium malachiteum TaxID=1324776 RepID=A0AAD6MQT4_9EURO|nr:hypothetical protein N7493_011064 [Penicillium malachiteum]